MTGASFLLILFILKLVATPLTLGSGGSGGIFSPALFMGATMGGAYGLLLHGLVPAFPISAPAYAIAGMAGLVGGATGAALTAIVMLLEMTLDYNVVIPLTITVAVSYGIRRTLCPESIYTMKLARRGRAIPRALRSNVHGLKLAREIMDRGFAVVSADALLSGCVGSVKNSRDIRWYLLEESGVLRGVANREDMLDVLCRRGESALLSDVPCEPWVSVAGGTSLDGIVAHMNAAEAKVAVVCRGETANAGDVLGIIGGEELANVLKETAELFPG